MPKFSKFIKWIRKGRSFPPPDPSPTITVPRAMHEMEWKDTDEAVKAHSQDKSQQLLAELVTFVVVKNARGATDARGLKELLQKETGEDIARRFNPTTEDWEPTYYCGRYRYVLLLLPPSDSDSFNDANITIPTFFGLVFSYDASSTESWDEMVASCEDISSRCKDGVIPFATIVLAMGEGCVSPEEAERFARQRSFGFFQYSPVTGQGLCRAFASIVEHSHGIKMQYATDPDGFQAKVKATAGVAQHLFYHPIFV